MAGPSDGGAFRRNHFAELFGEPNTENHHVDESLTDIVDEIGEAVSLNTEPMTQSVKSRLYDEDKVYGWSDVDTLPLISPFTSNRKINVEMPDDSQPIDFLELFFYQEIMNRIVQNTNDYAQAKIDGSTLKKTSRLKRWEPVTVDEMRVFLGLTIATGLVLKPSLPAYWSTEDEVLTPYFGSKMSCNRYQAILSNLHLVNKDEDNNIDPLFKIRPLFTHLRRQFCNVYSPDRELSFNEGLCPWKGRLRFRTYNSSKPTKFGLRLYEVCEASTGYIIGMEIYQGAAPITTYCEAVDLDDECTQTTMIVMDTLADCGLLEQGHHIYMDNFYTSPELFEELDVHNTYACGTIRKNRVNYPVALKDNAKLDQGECVFRRQRNMFALHYKDKRDVHMLSTIHNATLTTLSKMDKDNQPIKRPTCIVDYCRFMGGVDLADQICGNYTTLRKTVKWWRKLFFHLFCMAICNALILYWEYKGDRNISHYSFRLTLIKQLIAKATTAPVPTPHRGRHRQETEEEPLHLKGRHFPMYIPRQSADKPQPRRECVACNKPPSQREKKGKRHQSVFQCKTCTVPLCVPRCFEAYHTRVNYQQYLRDENN